MTADAQVDHSARQERFVICGMPRSGTTLLAEMLNRSPGVHIGPETHVLVALHDVADPNDLSSAELERAALRLRSNSLVFVSEEAVNGLTDAPAPGNLSEALFRVAGSGSVGARLIGEKTPRHLEYLAALLDVDPHLRAVIMIRDPRDVTQSLSEVGWNASKTWSNAITWVRYVRLAQAARSGNPERVRIVRFEDLVRHGDLVVEPLLRFLSGGGAPELTDARSAVTFDRQQEPWKARASTPPDPSRVEAWKRRRSTHDRLVGFLTADLLVPLGYQAPLGSKVIGPTARLLHAAASSARRSVTRWSISRR